MDSETRTALEESIAHWKRMASGDRRNSEAPTSDDCPLCEMFYNKLDVCDGCPVRIKTGRTYCGDTPYHDAQRAWTEYGLDSSEFKYAALAEVDFLTSLLPNETPNPNP